MARFTEEQLDQVKKINVLEYAQNNGYETKRVGSSFKIPGYGGLVIDYDGSRWNCLSDKDAGGGIIQFVQYMDQLDFRKAVEKLLDYGSIEREPNTEVIRNLREAKENKKDSGEFELPDRAQNYRRVFAYLTKTRQIDPEIVQYYVKHKKIYEDVRHNCVFCGGDEKGNIRSASLRGTYDPKDKEPFKGLVANSDKHYGFTYEGKSNRVLVFEAPIDMMSYQTLKKELGNNLGVTDHYQALNGMAHIGLSHYLENHPGIERVVFCLDNDKAGIKNICDLTTYIEDLYPGKYDYEIKSPTLKDWNADLIRIHEQNQKADRSMEEVVELEA